MKRLIILIALSVSSILVSAQDIIDKVFNKYSGQDHFTSIVISKDLLDFAFAMDKDTDKLNGKISDLKILISEKNFEHKGILSDEIRNSINSEKFVSLMEILDGKSKINFYVKKDNDKIVHLLLIANEDDEEVLLSLKGQFTMKDLSEFGKGSFHHGSFHHLSYLKDIDN